MQCLAYEINYIAIVRCLAVNSPRDYPNTSQKFLVSATDNLPQRELQARLIRKAVDQNRGNGAITSLIGVRKEQLLAANLVVRDDGLAGW